MQFKLKFFLPVLLLLFNVPVFAQVCTGSLGDPVFTFDFGSGNMPQFPTTSYTYVTGSCPEDGSYSLSKTETGCHDDTWHRVFQDHTGNDGYMMVVNADEVAGKEFFSYTLDAGALCEATTYEFSAYLLNLIKAGQSGFIRPNITFIIEKPDGTELKRETFDIPETSDSNGWVKYGIYFDTQGVTSVVIKMVNNAKGGGGNDFLLDDIAFRACGPDVHASFDGSASVTEGKACEGDPVAYTIKADAGQGYAYQWQTSTDNGITWGDIAGETDKILIIPPHTAQLGVYQYRLGVAKVGNILYLKCRVYSNPVTFNVTPHPAPPPLPPRFVCEGEVLTLTAKGGATYEWTGPNLSKTSQNPLIIPNASAANAGTYHVEVISSAGCTTPQQVNVTVNPKPVVDISITQNICRGSNTQISAFAADGVKYSWTPAAGLSNPNIRNPVASPNNSTLYTVTVTNANDCKTTNQVQVNLLDLPVANAGSDKKIFEGQSVKLDGSAIGDVTYTWSPPDYLDDPHSPTPVASPLHNITYTLTVVSDNNCGINESSVFVRVYNKLVIPTTFTPNNDGVNDIWNIEALETYPQGVITVYTRNGKQVFQSKGYGKPWDGKLNGALLPTGTYYYVIDLKNDTPKLSGWVMLVR